MVAAIDLAGGTIALIRLDVDAVTIIAGLPPMRDVMFGASDLVLYLATESLRGIGVTDVARGRLTHEIATFQPNQAVWSYTLIKVVGCDVWIGVWVLILSIIAVTRWEVAETGGGANIGEIWWRFPKFVVGFLLASMLITFAVRNVSFADYNTLVRPGLVQPITTLRTWAFTFSFLSIGLTTRFSGYVCQYVYQAGGVRARCWIALLRRSIADERLRESWS